MQTCTTSVVAVALCATVTMGDIIHITADPTGSPESPNSYGGFEGTLGYDAIGGGLARLVLTLTNTSIHDGWLTALAFDDAEGTGGWSLNVSESTSLGASWTDLAGPINTQPFGTRDHGAASNGDWQGGGDPHLGLAAGDSATWIFDGWGDATVSALDFLTPNGGRNLVIRFRGFGNGASDKLPATPVVPGAGGLAALAGVGLAGRRRRR